MKLKKSDTGFPTRVLNSLTIFFSKPPRSCAATVSVTLAQTIPKNTSSSYTTSLQAIGK